MAKWSETTTINETTWDARERRISDLEDTLALRDAATRSLCIAVHGREIEGKSIYELIHDVARLTSASQ